MSGSGADAAMTAARPLARGRAPARAPLSGVFWARALTLFWCSLSYVFLLSPMVVVMAASLDFTQAGVAVRFPPRHLSLEGYFRIPSGQMKALGLSFAIAAMATAAAMAVGVPAALGIVRARLRLTTFVSAIFRAPLQIPAIVTGIAFLQLFYIIGDATGLYWHGTLAGLVIGHAFVATPFVVGGIVAVLQTFNRSLEEAAVIHGASRWRAFRRVTLPVIMPGVYSGALYGFMVSFGDVPIAIFLTTPGFVTYPVEIFFSLEHEVASTMLASASLVMLICLALLLVVQRIIGLEDLLRWGGGSGR
jgi:putative spermidine/putrescine transport system permease protein